LRSRSSRGAIRWLVQKEWRELLASRAWWVLLGVIGPLVGVTFTNAVRTYAEISDGAGAGCGAVCDPLVGIWGPTFAAYEIAAVFFLPFVAIRLVAGDRQSGALKLELQRPMAGAARLAVKTVILLAGCLIASLASVAAIGLWVSYGGTVYWPELLVVGLGHLLNASLTISLAMLAAAVTEHPSTAAILALAITVGTWILEFAAAIRGGIWQTLARFTPSAMIANFQHGLLPVGTLLVAVALTSGALLAGAAWLRLGEHPKRRLARSLAIAAVTVVVATASSRVKATWDMSEGRLNSFSVADQEALEGIGAPIRIEAHLAPEDPRRLDLERHALAKLRRAVPRVEVAFVSRTSTGLFEQSDASYGEIRYDVGPRRVVGRATTEDAVLEAIFEAAAVEPDRNIEAPFMGHPLVTRPAGAALIFYGAWPALAALAAWRATRQPSSIRRKSHDPVH
jgi:ABC-2 type transport system permease protein